MKKKANIENKNFDKWQWTPTVTIVTTATTIIRNSTTQMSAEASKFDANYLQIKNKKEKKNKRKRLKVIKK